jgi:hypothetical protein
LVAENLPVSNGQIGGGRLWVVVRRRSAEVPKLVRGTVMTHRRRCGKPNCRCAEDGEWHEQVILSYSEHSRAKSVTLPGELVAPVRAATARYRAARQTLESEANAGLESLVSQLHRRA